MGIFIKTFDEPEIAKFIKDCGFDFFVLDNEHGFFDYNRIKNLLLYAKAIDMFSVVRVPGLGREAILKCLDMGADGLILPNTETVEQAQTLVKHSKYAPMGDRGVALFGIHTNYENVDSVEYMKKANEETVLIVQIESYRGLKNLKGIMEIEGIDAAHVGPADYTQSIGIPGQIDHPKFLKDMEELVRICKEAGKAPGIYGKTVNATIKWCEMGMQVNSSPSEVDFFMSAAKNFMDGLKAKY